MKSDFGPIEIQSECLANFFQGQMLEPIAEVPRIEAILVDREFSYVEQPQTFSERYSSELKIARTLVINLIFGGYFAWATYHFIKNSKYQIQKNMKRLKR